VARRRIETIPLYFEAVGTARTDAPFVHPVTVSNAINLATVEAAVHEAEAAGAEIAVIPTFGFFPAIAGIPNLPYGPYGALIAHNVPPHGPRSSVHTLLVSGEHAGEVAAGPTSASIRASIEPGSAENVTGWFGPPVPDPVIITTPLSGWFNCAGERGTGIAVALDLAADLAQSGQPVFVLGTTSHEFENYGVEQYLEANEVMPRAVFHIGASVAAAVPDATTGQMALAPFRWFTARTEVDSLRSVMAQAGFFFRPAFAGEAIIWAAHLPASTPLFSVAGTFPLFHTPQDEPSVATSPELLAVAYQALRDAADIVL
jgi:hypothetical protein